MSYELERKHLLTDEEINKLLTIINSDLQDFEKAQQLRVICKGSVLLNNINKYETTDFKKAVILKRILSYYEKYENRNYFMLLHMYYDFPSHSFSLLWHFLLKSQVLPAKQPFPCHKTLHPPIKI